MRIGQFKFHNIFPIFAPTFFWLVMIGQPGGQRLPLPWLGSNFDSWIHSWPRYRWTMATPYSLKWGFNMSAYWRINFFVMITIVKNFLVESGRNGHFRHETPKVIPQILTCLKYTAFPRWILPYFSYPSKKLMFSVLKTFHFTPCFTIFFSAENIIFY